MRYYFHLRNDVDAPDDEGRELGSIEAAREIACEEARMLAADEVGRGHLNLDHAIEVTDGAGVPLFRVAFGEAVTVSGDGRRLHDGS
jgi:hypothetical protein